MSPSAISPTSTPSARRHGRRPSRPISCYPIAPGIIGAAAAYFAQAAKEAGVTAIVNMSQISARRESASHAAQDHWVSERVLDWSDVPTTHLRPTFFADWLVYPHFAKEIWAKKKIEFPFENGRHARPSRATTRAASSPISWPIRQGHAGKIYTLHGPVEMNQAEIAAAMSDVLGAKIEYTPSVDRGVPAGQVGAAVQIPAVL